MLEYGRLAWQELLKHSFRVPYGEAELLNVINIDQIGVHLVPTIGERTWEMKGKKDIHVVRIEDKDKLHLQLMETSYLCKLFS